MEAIITGWFTAHLTEWMKQHPAIPLQPEWVMRIRLVVALLALGFNVLAAYLEGPEAVAKLDMGALLKAAGNAVAAYWVAEATYQASIKKVAGTGQ